MAVQSSVGLSPSPETGDHAADTPGDVEGGLSPECLESPSTSSYYPLPNITRVLTQVGGAAVLLSISVFSLCHSSTARGFFCDDESIALPYKEQSFPFSFLLYSCMMAPVMLITLLELLIWGGRAYSWRYNKKEIRIGSWNIPQVLIDIYVHIGGFIFAIIASWIVSETLKISVGSLRPHFLSVCKPDWSKITCKEGRRYVYVSNYVCTGTAELIREAERSFPSGHASNAFCGLGYLIFYIQGRFKWQRSKTSPRFQQANRSQNWWRAALYKLYWIIEAATPTIQVLLILSAAYIAATRVVDHYHHVRDVVAGGVIGIIMSMHAAFFVVGIKAT